MLLNKKKGELEMNPVLKKHQAKKTNITLQELIKKLREKKSKEVIAEALAETIEAEAVITPEAKKEILKNLDKATNTIKLEDAPKEHKKIIQKEKEKLVKELKQEVKQELKEQLKEEKKIKRPSDGFIEDLELLKEMKDKKAKKRGRPAKKKEGEE